MLKVASVPCEHEDIYMSSEDESCILTFFFSIFVSAIVGVVAGVVSIKSGSDFFSGAWSFFLWLGLVASTICLAATWKKVARLVVSPVVLGVLIGFWSFYAIVRFIGGFLRQLF